MLVDSGTQTECTTFKKKKLEGKGKKTVEKQEQRQEDDSLEFNRNPEAQTSKARAITRGRMPLGPKTCQGTTPSWMEGGVSLSKNILREDPDCVDALCWIQNGEKPEKICSIYWT